MSSFEPVQASSDNIADRAVSDTEMARQVAAALKWKVHTEVGSVHEEDSMLVAPSMEALAQAGWKLGWFLDDARGIFWGSVHSYEPWRSAMEVREALRQISGGSLGPEGSTGVVIAD